MGVKNQLDPFAWEWLDPAMEHFKGTGGIGTANRKEWNSDTRLSLEFNDDGSVTLTISTLTNIYIGPHARITLPAEEACKLRELLD